MLIASTGFSMDVHYCDGEIKRASVLGKAMTCAEVEACLIKCGKPYKSCSSQKKGCCDNQSFVVDFDFDGAEVDSAISSDSDKDGVLQTQGQYLVLVDAGDSFLTVFYRPPPLTKDLQIRYQSFLI